MDDLISRQELLKRTIYNPLHVLYISSQDVLDCPSAQKKGHWIDGSCSVCGCDEPMFIEDWNVEHCKTPFCPNCGADMRGEEDG